MSRMSALRDSAARPSAACARSALTRSVLESPAALLERGARPLQLGQRALTCDDAIARRASPARSDVRGRLPDLTDVRRRQEQPQVAALAELVDVDEPAAQFGPARGFLRSSSCIRCVFADSSRGDLCRVGRDLTQFFRLELPIDFERTKVAEQRPFLRRRARQLPAEVPADGRWRAGPTPRCALGPATASKRAGARVTSMTAARPQRRSYAAASWK